MVRSLNGIKWERTSGETVRVDDVSATPQCQALSVRCPMGGWVWNRPVGVIVERGGEEQYVPVVDLTRLIQIALYGIALVFAVGGFVLWMTERRASDE